jgi:hypothetical protein
MTQTINSVKTVDLADLPLRLNLQYFSDGEESIEADVQDDVEETLDEEVQDETEDSEEEIEQEEGAEDPEIADQEPERNLESDRAFAEMRRKAEQAEARANNADDVIARQYGESHGIYTVEQYEQAYAEEQQEAERQAYLARGIDPDEIKQIVNDQLENHPSVVAAKKAEDDNRLFSNFTELQSEYSDMVKEPNDVPEEVWKRWKNGQTGLSLTEAFTLVNRKEIIAKQSQIAKQTALNNLNGKQHIKGNGGANGDLETVTVPDDVFKMYRQLNPKATEKDILKHYKNSIRG